MTTGPQRQSPYPKTPHEALGSQWATAHQVYGSGDTSALFKGAPQVSAPWPKAGSTKANPKGYDADRVQRAMADPAQHMRQMDPRDLHSTQPWVTQGGASYYMTDEYRQTGRTFADMDKAGNRTPIVYTDTQGRNKILSGHHRATAALLRGEQFHALNVTED